MFSALLELLVIKLGVLYKETIEKSLKSAATVNSPSNNRPLVMAVMLSCHLMTHTAHLSVHLVKWILKGKVKFSGLKVLVFLIYMMGVAFIIHWVSFFREHKINLTSKTISVMIKMSQLCLCEFLLNHQNHKIFLLIISIIIKYSIH